VKNCVDGSMLLMDLTDEIMKDFLGVMPFHIAKINREIKKLRESVNPTNASTPVLKLSDQQSDLLPDSLHNVSSLNSAASFDLGMTDYNSTELKKS